MNLLDYSICSSNLTIVKKHLDELIIKMVNQKNPNIGMVDRFKNHINRLNESFMWFNETKENSSIIEKRNRDLEGFLISQKAYIIDLEKDNKELKFKAGLNDKVANDNLELTSEIEVMEQANEHLRSK